MSYTLEQRAIRQFLSRPAPWFDACGCMGAQPIGGPQNLQQQRVEDSTVVLKEVGPQKNEVIKVIRVGLGIGMMEAKKMVESAPVTVIKIGGWGDVEKIKKELEAAGATVNREPPPKMFPVCPCQMQMVEEVAGSFYWIKETRTPDGITHEAFLLGPVGGPYNLKAGEA